MKLIGVEEHFLMTEARETSSSMDLAAPDTSVAIHWGILALRLLDLVVKTPGIDGRDGPRRPGSVVEHARRSTVLGPESVEMAKRTNDAVAAAITHHPTHVQALATLPVARPESQADASAVPGNEPATAQQNTQAEGEGEAPRRQDAGFGAQ